MKINTTLVLALGFLFFSCQTYDNPYEKCMNERMIKKGSRFYEPLQEFETLLLKKKLLNDRKKESYINAFKSLHSKKDSLKWQSLYDSIKTTQMSTFINENRFEFFFICSNIDIKEMLKNSKSKIYSYEIQKYNFNKFAWKEIDDEEVSIEIILFTDYNNKIDRLNVTYLLFLQLENKFGKSFH